jgi:hypothetical protein
MGLDISYYSEVIEVENSNDSEWYFNSEDCHFEYQLGGLKKNTNYISTNDSECDSFGAGSYSGYNYWRNKLSQLAGYDDANSVWQDFNGNLRYLKLKKIEGEVIKMKPFYELIYFSDCEGIIGPEISEKLYADFVDFDDKAKEQDDYFYSLYCKFKEAFRVAAKGGLVSFN